MNNSIIEVVFKVSAKLKNGEDIRLCGNVPALGGYNPERALKLYSSPKDQPWWHTKEALFLPGDKRAVKYRYCIFSGGKFVRWEGGTSFERILNVDIIEHTVKTVIDIFGQLTISPTQQTPSVSAVTNNSKIFKTSDTHSFKARQFAEWSRRSGIDHSVVSSDGVIIVSYFLPINLHRSNEGLWTATWDEENILAFSSLDVRITWVGSIRYAGAPIPIEEEEEVDTAEIGAKSQQDLWFTYSTVNNLFRDKVVEVFHRGDLVWIHGFHLMLLPAFIRRQLQLVRIGFFFHTPFPSSEIWRTLTFRGELLRGILAADQIGFHLYEFARHFITSCHRILGYNSDSNSSGVMTINIDGREVAITCIHVGVDLPRLQKEFNDNRFMVNVNIWRKLFPNKIVVSAIDKLERLKGIPLKLNAIHEFIETNPQYVGKIVFAIIGVTASERGSDYKRTVHDVLFMVNALNEKYSISVNDPLVYFEEKLEKEVKLEQRLAFFGASDILMLTASRDGLNRFPMEFTLAKQRVRENYLSNSIETTNVSQGLIIVSEFIPSARVLRGALIVNPWNVIDVTNALKQALEMPESEINDRVRRNLEFSTRLTTTTWAQQVLYDLKCVEKSEDPNSTSTFGFGTGFRVIGVRAGFHTLDVSIVSKAYRSASNRLILLDWGGTLVAEGQKSDNLHAYAMAQGHLSRDGITDQLKNYLTNLCSDEKNYVFVVSGKDLGTVSTYFSAVEGLGLAAEHGCYYLWPRDEITQNSKDEIDLSRSNWNTMLSYVDQSWKDAAKKIMENYVKRTHGTYIEQKGNALIWQFRDADPEFGFLQSKELEDHLKEFLTSYPVEIIRGGGAADGYIEVRLAGLSKGHFLVHALEILKSKNIKCDFILAVGDDSSDEPMFEEISKLRNIEGLSAFSVTVGKKPTSAFSYVDDINSVTELINTLSKVNSNTTFQMDKKYLSTVDLKSHHRLQDNRRQNNSVVEGIALSSSHRASSDNHLFKPDEDEVKKSDKKVLFNNEFKTTSGQAPTPGLGFSRSGSNAHLSMTAYLHSISEDQDEEGGNFF
eukprot:gene20435-26517_t